MFCCAQPTLVLQQAHTEAALCSSLQLQDFVLVFSALKQGPEAVALLEHHYGSQSLQEYIRKSTAETAKRRASLGPE